MKNLLKSIGWAVLIVGLALSLAFGFNVKAYPQVGINSTNFQIRTND